MNEHDAPQFEDYDVLTNEEFDEALADIMEEKSAGSLLQVPGAYEVFSEHFNNEVLDLAMERYRRRNGLD